MEAKMPQLDDAAEERLAQRLAELLAKNPQIVVMPPTIYIYPFHYTPTTSPSYLRPYVTC
jgi:hypothetical protein